MKVQPTEWQKILANHISDKWLAFDIYGGSLVAQMVKNPPTMQDTPVWFLAREDPMEKGNAPVFWPGGCHGLYSPGGCRVGHDWVTFISPDIYK